MKIETFFWIYFCAITAILLYKGIMVIYQAQRKGNTKAKPRRAIIEFTYDDEVLFP